ncbi:MAG: radical SAM protein, partial [Anaerolineales bacterium]
MVNTPLEIQQSLQRILPKVQKPGRYSGGEFNQILKDWTKIPLRVCLVFPDIYDIGMSNLGLAILYDLINQREDALAERAFAPWLDMEDQLRQANLPLYALESKHPLSDFDIIGFTLPYESLFTNTLNILNLAQIPLFSSQRTSHHPLIIAGGHATFNPEPMHAFIDAFVIGEGEEVIHEVLDVYASWKTNYQDSLNEDNDAQAHSMRKELLRRLAQLEGVYVPAFYQAYYNLDQTFSHLVRTEPSAPQIIRKRIVAKLPPPPEKFIVPYIETIHDRIPIEIMRGCTRGCRFCQAGMVTRPVRERPVEEIIKAIQESLNNTGYEEVGL